MGASRANRVVSSTTAASSTSLITSICEPSSTWSVGMPTSWQIFLLTSSLSPVSTLTDTPCSRSAAMAGMVVSLGGSKKAM